MLRDNRRQGAAVSEGKTAQFASRTSEPTHGEERVRRLGAGSSRQIDAGLRTTSGSSHDLGGDNLPCGGRGRRAAAAARSRCSRR